MGGRLRHLCQNGRTPMTSLSEWADAYGRCRENAYGLPPLGTRVSLLFVRIYRRNITAITGSCHQTPLLSFCESP
ncbi:hypothetical protein QVD17_31056 [Tagetes erecta]|uniref:Uncharacterized protein n=1 Tax=Tagetes erecta TaxID=13708 RepID=A0AAD8NNZ3_TARER|nr:hypothetical protein QVD17_31056 [Tagetes erecta]